MKTDVGEI